MRTFFFSLMASALLAAFSLAAPPARAQVEVEGNKGPPALTRRSDEEKKRDAEIDKEYRDSLKRTRSDTAAPKADPWGSVRPQPEQKTGKR